MLVCLASSSPRRLKLLEGIGIEPVVLAAAIPEFFLPAETVETGVQRLARAKGEAVLPACPAGTGLLIAADTVIALDRDILGKPGSPAAAEEMLGRLSGRRHRVLTGMTLYAPASGVWKVSVTETIVLFSNLDSRLIEEYVKIDKVTDCAGAYRIQGRGACLLDSECGITGSYSNVVGLPLERLFVEAAELGIDLLNL